MSKVQTQPQRSITAISTLQIRLDIGGANIRIEDSNTNPQQGLDMDVAIEKEDGAEYNKCTLNIYNLPTEILNTIIQDAEGFDVYVKYDGEFKLVYRGNVENVNKDEEEATYRSPYAYGIVPNKKGSKRTGDRVTTITLKDGLYSLYDKKIAKTYEGSISGKQIIEDCMTQVGIPIGKISENIVFKAHTNYTARGLITSVLNDVASYNQALWSITNGYFYFYLKNETIPTFAYVLTEDNAGDPKVFKTKKQSGYKIDAPFIPTIQPEDYVSLDFPYVQGTKRVFKVKQIFNNYGTKAITQLEVVND